MTPYQASKNIFSYGVNIMGHISKVYALSEEEFIALCNSEINYSAVSRALGYGEVGTYTFELIKKRLTELNRQDLMDKLGSRQLTSYSYQPMISSDEDIQKYFAKNTHHGTTTMKRILLRKGLLKYECYYCGNQGSWRGQELKLQLHHLDGDKNNNEVSNLVFTCPNCHSQTDSFTAKNALTETGRAIYESLTREDLKDALRQQPLAVLCREWDIGKGTLERWCKEFDLPFTKTEIRSYSDSDWAAL